MSISVPLQFDDHTENMSLFVGYLWYFCGILEVYISANETMSIAKLPGKVNKEDSSMFQSVIATQLVLTTPLVPASNSSANKLTEIPLVI